MTLASPGRKIRRLITSDDRLDLGPFREAFERSGMTVRELADALEWTRPNAGRSVPDVERVKVTLGLKYRYERTNGVVRHHTNRTISYDNAVLLTRAMGLDPVDLGV